MSRRAPHQAFKPWIVRRPRGGCQVLFPLSRLDSLVEQVLQAAPTCRTCAHLRAFELTRALFTCPVVNIRLHRQSIRVFGCRLHEPALTPRRSARE